MRSLSPMFVLSLMLLMSLSPMLLQSDLGERPEESSAVPKALIDFEVTSIEIGNASRDAKTWLQPDGSEQEYVMRDETIQINVTFTQAGSSGQPAAAEGFLQIWHPVGFLIVEFNVSMILSGFQSSKEEFIWTPTAAHSALDENGFLVGGIELKGIIDGGLGDDNEVNNNLLRNIPVALWHDPMENGFCGDVDNDQIVDCPNQLQSNIPTWVGAGYDPDDSLSSDPDNFGHWRMDNSESAEGSLHWRVSRSGSDYGSNRHDRLWWGWFTPFQSCEDPGHGLGYGTLDPAVTSSYGNNFCKIRIRGFDFLSMHLVTNAWGEMAAGDQIRLEADAGPEEYYNYTSQSLSTTSGDWTQLVWDMTGMHPSADFTMAFLFDSNSSYASQGIHLDSFLLFGIEKVPEYTLDVDCDDPLPNSYMVIPADSAPPSLHCTIKNNGYIDITLRLYTEVTNQSWMWGFPLRIDSNNNVDHDNFVVTKVIHALETMETWFNLSIPDGAGVQDLDWDVWVNDGVTNLTKNYMRFPVSVMASYSCKLQQESLQNPAATLYPGESGVVPMILKNTGNQLATWNLGVSFPNQDWTNDAGIEWQLNGSEITQTELSIIDEIAIDAIITVPDRVEPGTYEITLLSSGQSPAQYQAEWLIYIVVPVYYELDIESEVNNMVAPADDALRLIEFRLINHGNAEEAFDLSIISDWHLDISMNTEQTFEIDPFGGDVTVTMLLPMPYGIVNETYSITLVATSKTNPDYQASKKIFLTVPETYLVEVEDIDMLNEVFRGGDDSRTVNWRIWNRGNTVDSFRISFDHLSDVSVSDVGLNNGITPYVAPGESFNLTVRYSFGDLAFGDRVIELTATSINAESAGQSSFNTGEAVFQVGTQGWIKLQPPAPLVIVEKGYEIELVFTVTNNHPTDAQLLRTDIERDSPIFNNIIDARVDTGDQTFVLDAQDSRTITVFLTVTDDNLKSLSENEMTFELILEVDGDIDKVSSSATVRMHKISPIEEGPNKGFIAQVAGNILFILIGLGVIIGVMIAAFGIMKTASNPLEVESSFGDYELTVGGAPSFDGIPEAPELPSADSVANSMFGGTQDMFEQPAPPPMPDPSEMPMPESMPEPEQPAMTEPESPPTPEPVPILEPKVEEIVDSTEIKDEIELEEEPVVEDSTEPELPAGVPPIPDEGLPPGWSIEQWVHYGQQWVDQQNQQ
jgi:uncharacterized membrane protein